jgi:divalent metal cation (Fe/Co/Zn/Cd) transporter
MVGSKVGNLVGIRVGFGNPERPKLLARGLRLAAISVGWNVLEGLLAVAAAALAGSIALLGFGLDSFIESASALIIVWRTLAERRARDSAHVEAIELRASKLVAGALVLLALYILYDAARALLDRDRPAVSWLGIAVLLVSIPAMQWLARAKRRNAIALGSRSMQSDAFQATTCLYLSVTALAGIALNAAFGWWWADPLAALVMIPLLAREARDAWEGKCCDEC